MEKILQMISALLSGSDNINECGNTGSKNNESTSSTQNSNEKIKDKYKDLKTFEEESYSKDAMKRAVDRIEGIKTHREDLTVKLNNPSNSEYVEKKIEEGIYSQKTYETDSHHIISVQAFNNNKELEDAISNNQEYNKQIKENLTIIAKEKIIDAVSKDNENAWSQGANERTYHRKK